ncbi:MAG TPA: TrkH family potassium uptake protein [Symbiobacteriaceae bacterium]|nr:TrkH family potassium uptake protein [Symbiobacteriaceae bacterium]
MSEPTRPKTRFQFTPPQVLVLGFAALILFGSFLLWLPISAEPGKVVSYVDALFTATTSVCVTGLVTVDVATTFNTFGELTVLGLIQAGGLGIMTLSAVMLLLMGKRVSLRERLLMQEALGSFSIAGVVRLTRNIIFTTLAIEGISALALSLYWLRQYPWQKAFYWGFFHAISAFNNAGIDVTSESLRPFQRDPWVLFIIGMLIILGGIGFPVLEDVWRNRRWEKLTLHSRLSIRMTVILIGIGTLLYLAAEWHNTRTFAHLPWYHKISNAWFAAVTPRTAGFESVFSGKLLDFSILLTIILMFIGASPGGTGGGIKTTSFAMIMMSIRATSTGRDEVTLMGRKIPRDLIEKAFAITSIAMLLCVTVTAALMLTERPLLESPENPFYGMNILFEVVSAFGTVGLTTGVTPFLSVAGKILITLTMYIGRVGPLTMAVALAQRNLNRSPLHYPEDRVMIG